MSSFSLPRTRAICMVPLSYHSIYPQVTLPSRGRATNYYDTDISSQVNQLASRSPAGHCNRWWVRKDQWINIPTLHPACTGVFSAILIAGYVIGVFLLQISDYKPRCSWRQDSTILHSRSSPSTSDVEFRMPPRRPAATLGE